MTEALEARDTSNLPQERDKKKIGEEQDPFKPVFLYALHQRVRVRELGAIVFVVLRRRYDEGELGTVVQYVLVAEADVDAQGRYVPHRTDFEEDLLPVEETP
jgi:hypothetical protein